LINVPCCKLLIGLKPIAYVITSSNHLFLIYLNTKNFYSPKSWAGGSTHVLAPKVDEASTINCNGAGDAFTAGFLVAAMLRKFDMENQINLDDSLKLEVAAHFASLVALQHICSSTRDCAYLNIDDLMDHALVNV